MPGMTDLPTDPVPYAEFIMRYLMQRVEPEGSPALAVAETEEAVDGDRWFWADDNAKVLEFLALPALWNRWPDRCRDVLEFIESLCDGPFILRRTGHARLEERAREGGAGRWVHTFMNLSCDLPNGSVTVGMRFHDIRTARNLILNQHQVEFQYQGRGYRLVAEGRTTAHSMHHEGLDLVLSHTNDLRFDPGTGPVRLGTLVATFRFDGRSMFVGAELALDLDPGITISDVILGFGHDQLSHNENAVHYGDVGLTRPGQAPTQFTAGALGETWLDARGADYFLFSQREEMRGFALAIHSLPDNPADMLNLQVLVQEAGRLHRVVSRHSFPGPHQGGARLVAREKKILTAGGFYDQVADCAGLVQRRAAMPTQQPVDISISYDYGAEINAFARCYRTLSAMPDSPEVVALRDKSRVLFDRYHQVYADVFLARHFTDPAAIFSRPLAFVVYGLIDMAIATGEDQYKAALRDAVRVMFDFERGFAGVDGNPESAFLMGQVTCVSPFVDCHSAVLLALVRALPVLEDPAFITSIDRGLEAYRAETTAVELGDMRKQDVITVHWTNEHGQRLNPHAYWNFCAGLTLRLFKLLRQSTHQATTEIHARHEHKLEIYEAMLRLQLRRSLVPREGGALEVLTGRLSGEGNSETQPWVALGLVEDSGDLGPEETAATQLTTLVVRLEATDPRLHTTHGQRDEAGLRFANAASGTALYGPYMDLPAGRYRACLSFAEGEMAHGQGVMDVCVETGSRVLARVPVSAARLQAGASLTFSSDEPLRQVEVRLFNGNNFTGRLERLEIFGE